MTAGPSSTEAEETHAVAMPLQRAQVVMWWFMTAMMNMIVWVMLMAMPASPLMLLALWVPPFFTALWCYVASEGAWADGHGIRAVVLRETWVPWSRVGDIWYLRDMGSIMVEVPGPRSLRIARSQRFPSKKQVARAEAEIVVLKRLKSQAGTGGSTEIVRRWRRPSVRQWLLIACAAAATLLLAAT